MKRSIKIFLSVSCIAALITFGCKKKETTEVDNETQSAVDNAVADQEYSAVVPNVQNFAINTKGTGANSGKLAAAPCDTLTWLNKSTSYTYPGSTTYPMADTALNTTGDLTKYKKAPIYELNLATNCAQGFTDGKIRSGKWIIRITGPLKTAGNQMIIKLLNHKTNNAITYACDSMVITTVASSTLSTTYNIKLINGVCQSSSWVIKYSSDRTITHYAKGNPYGSDPVTELFGSANGTNRQARAFTVSIPSSSPLIKHKACQFIDKGIMTLTPEGFKERIVNFGPGTCDDDATFTVNGNTVAFKLK
ncbi:MAG: hypothetical protein HYX39_04360 [Bacteroidetes bacterium]|nr:hypothetical protein [Bacteroidota bacterium]